MDLLIKLFFPSILVLDLAQHSESIGLLVYLVTFQIFNIITETLVTLPLLLDKEALWCIKQFWCLDLRNHAWEKGTSL